MQRVIKRAIFALSFGIVIYFIILIGLYVMQEHLLYHPTPLKPNIPLADTLFKNMQEINYSLPNGKRVYAWYHAPGKKNKIVVFFHGNSYNLEKFIDKMEPWIKAGYGLLAPEYEGFGHIPGDLRQAQLETDAKTAIAYLNSKGFKNQDIILYGHSLGTYVATYTAQKLGQENPFDAVILEAPFFSLLETARTYVYGLVPLSWIMKDIYPTFELVDQINTRVFIGHGKKDKVIPYTQGLRLFNQARHPKIFYSSDQAGHNDLPKYGFLDAVLEWL